MASKTGSSFLKGRTLVAAITSVCASGFLLFGYDQGVMSGVVVSNYFLDTMGHPSSLMLGTITSLYDVGAIFGAIAAAFCAEPLGRKRTLLLGTSILSIGTIIMGSSFDRVQFMVSRVITGLGIGFICSVTPVYQSEIALAAQRGWQICAQLSTMLFGLMLAYIINYGMYFRPGSVQWRFPLLFQLVFAIYILCVTPFLPDTPRWLMRHELNSTRGQEVLCKLRNKTMDDAVVRQEVEAIRQAIEIESREEGSWTDLFHDGGIAANKRFYLAVTIQFAQQMTGINIVTYYAPTLFQKSLGMGGRMSLLMGLLLQVFYLLASFVTWYTIDRIGRRKLFISCAIGMCIVLVLEGACVAVGNKSSGIAAVFFVFAFEAFFTWGWMATVWTYPPEILPLKIRAKGAALAAAADFAGNFLVVEVTPVGINSLGFGFYFIWAALNLVNAVIVFLFFPETANMPLESIDLLFTERVTESVAEVKPPFYRKLQWAPVARAAEEVRHLRRRRKDQHTGESPTASSLEHGDSDDNKMVERKGEDVRYE